MGDRRRGWLWLEQEQQQDTWDPRHQISQTDRGGGLTQGRVLRRPELVFISVPGPAQLSSAQLSSALLTHVVSLSVEIQTG